MAFKKIPQSPPKPWPAYPLQSLQNYVCFSLLTSGLEGFGHKSTTSDMPWIEAYCQKATMKMGGSKNAERSTFWSALAREFLDAVQFPAFPSSTSAAPQIFLLTAASYSHSTSTSLHSICFMGSLALERAASHLKVTRPLAYSSFHHGKMLTTLINSICDIIMNYSEEKLCDFADSKLSTLISHPN